MIPNCRVVAVECGVKAGNLGKMRQVAENRSDRREIMGLVQRSKGNVTL